MIFTLQEQIQAVRREIAMRERVYPRWVGAGKMTKTKADYELSAMRAVLKTLLDAAGDSGEVPVQTGLFE